MNWLLLAQLAVALAAIWGASLSTWTAFSRHREKHIKVLVIVEMERGYFSEERNGRNFDYPVRANLTAINLSPRRGLTLEKAGAASVNRLSKRTYKELSLFLLNGLLRKITFNKIRPIYTKRISNRLNLIVEGELPHKLEPDDSHRVVLKPTLSSALMDTNVSNGKMLIRGFFKDTAGNIYESKEPDEIDWSKYIPRPKGNV